MTASPAAHVRRLATALVAAAIAAPAVVAVAPAAIATDDPPASAASDAPDASARPTWIDELEARMSRADARTHATTAAVDAADCTTTWTGPSTGGDWTDERNWNAGTPDIDDIACITADEVRIPADGTVLVGRLAADADLVVEGRLSVGDGSHARKISLVGEYDRASEPTLGVQPDSTLAVDHLEAHQTAGALVIGTGTLFVGERLDVFWSKLQVFTPLGTAEGVAAVIGKESSLTLAGGGNLDGDWTVDADGRIETNTVVGWFGGSTIAGDGGLHVLDRGRMLVNGTATIGTTDVAVGGELAVGAPGSTFGGLGIGGTVHLDRDAAAKDVELRGGTVDSVGDLTVTGTLTSRGGSITTSGDATASSLVLAEGLLSLEGTRLRADRFEFAQGSESRIALDDAAGLDLGSGVALPGSSAVIDGAGFTTIRSTFELDRASVDLAGPAEIGADAFVGVSADSSLRLRGDTVRIRGGVHAAGALEFSGIVEVAKEAVVSGVSLSVPAGGRLVSSGWMSATTFGDAGDVELRDDARLLVSEGTTVTGGFALAGTSQLVSTGGVAVTRGRLDLGTRTGVDVTGGDPVAALVVGPDGELSGTGAVFGDVRNDGVVAPGEASAYDRLTIDGSYVQTGALRIRVGQLHQDELHVTGTARLGGTLDVRADRDAAMPGSYGVLVASALSGDFTTAPDGCHRVTREDGTVVVHLRLCVRVDDAEVAEDGGVAEVPVSLSSAPNQPVRVSWTTEEDTAKAGEDFEPETGTVEFAPDETEKVVQIPVHDDDDRTGDVEFSVKLELAMGAEITRGTARVVIRENETLPEWTTRSLTTLGAARITHLDESTVYWSLGDVAYASALSGGKPAKLPGVLRVADTTAEGLAVGMCTSEDPGPREVPCWNDGEAEEWTPMRHPDGGIAEVVAIADDGRVVGRFTPFDTTAGVRDLLWSGLDAVPTDLEGPGLVVDLNASGDMVFTSEDGGPEQSWFRSADGYVTQLPGPIRPGTDRTVAAALGDDGRVVGSWSGAGVEPTAWIWSADLGSTELGRGTPTDLNARGDVVGDVTVAGRTRAWVSRDDRWSLLHEVGDAVDLGLGEYSGALAINDSRIIGASLGLREYDAHTDFVLYPLGSAPEPSRLDLGGRMDEPLVSGDGDDRVLVVDRTVDGNAVRLTATAYDNDERDERPVTGLRLRFLVDGEVVHESEPFDLAPGSNREEHYDWDTTGLAWSGGELSEPFAVRMELVGEEGVVSALEGEVAVEPRPVVGVPGHGAEPDGWSMFADRLDDVRDDWSLTVSQQALDGASATIEANARQLAADVRSVRAVTNAAQVDLVAHSTGGLVARSYIDGLMPTGDARTVAQLLMLGTPNAGSACADFFLDPAHLEFRTDLVARFNAEVSDAHGVRFAAAGGTEAVHTCGTDEPGDGATTIGSALAGVADVRSAPLLLEELLGDEELFTQFVLPRLRDARALEASGAFEAGLRSIGLFFDGLFGATAAPGASASATDAPQLLSSGRTTVQPGQSGSAATTAPPGPAERVGITIAAPGTITGEFRRDLVGSEQRVPLPPGTGRRATAPPCTRLPSRAPGARPSRTRVPRPSQCRGPCGRIARPRRSQETSARSTPSARPC
ncbi:hypothetical protein ET445_02170 [Agromyces protaetiae]|uniref:Calx-beta domain-containing protein n=1 Tax=Agromyces protaetiae TaxID=2509455 RepID=A0A4P6F898_9MICO|nr:Calx-beta domain-containing protein [Agromyces protaetiae]QAY72320.1 hypothetical protein ET445_02170 [Agromyces protaetiae]